MTAPSPLARWALLIAVPLAYVAVSLVIRDHGGPEWIWRHLDPDYFYLFDGLNIATLSAPGHVGHPGVPLHVLAGLVVRLAHPLADEATLVQLVLADPEGHLLLAGTVLIGLIGLSMAGAGWMAWRATGSLALAVLVEMGPLLSMLTVKFALRVKPEALLVAVVLVMAALMLAALDKARLDRHRLRFAVAFGIVAGFGAATKIVAAPLLGLLPVFLLARPRAVLAFWAVCVVATVVFFLPAASEAGRFLDWITLIGKGSGAFGQGPQTGIDPGAWATGFRRMLSRSAVSVPLVAGLVALAWTAVRHRRGERVRGGDVRALAGLLLAVVAQAAVAGKQPSGHYMIPAYALGGLGLALSLRLIADPRFWPGGARRIAWGTGVLAALLVVAQGASLMRLDREMRQRRADALAPNDALAQPRFAACAQVSFFPSSSPEFALMMGDAVTRSDRGPALAAHVPPGRFIIYNWLPDEPVHLRGPLGPVSLKAVLADYPCTVFRGGHVGRLTALLDAEGLAGPTFQATCETRYETLRTVGVDCPDL